MAEIKFLLYIILYLIIAVLCIKLIKKLFHKNNKLRIIFLSICYTAFFGIGFWGSSGGIIAVPLPILGAAIIYVWEWSPWNDFIEGVMFPFVFWWIIVLILMLIINKIKKENSLRQI